MYRKVFVAEHSEDLMVRLPDEYLHKGIEVIAFELDSNTDELYAAKKDAARKAMRFFDSIQVDLSHYRFNRDEANER
ncbi:hypothetical protein [Dyadobacter sp. Leaf189]|uniref:hypothetical protein n=1 Tax=Dyadobacter sp. Leaf189 TaxID=1736295 RepID=UPI0006F43093|nr:hypothetical protein [Dyadobacter sp. Leaf189]KQS26784.1 hypothetical protein ASG33_19730 [Dyadobacter sp. Leaf189]